jgi:hypothetical protein
LVLLCLVRTRSTLSPKRVADARDRAGSVVGSDAGVGFCSAASVLCCGLTPQGGGTEVVSFSICQWAVEHDLLFPWPQLKGRQWGLILAQWCFGFGFPVGVGLFLGILAVAICRLPVG